MPNPPEVPKLAALTLEVTRTATARYLEDGDAARWEKDVSTALTRGHMAAYISGLAERDTGGKIRAFLSWFVGDWALSKDDRQAIKTTVAEQLDYLKRFVDIAGDLSEDQIKARADQYALATKQSYWQAWAGAELDCLPGQCEECYGNCRCVLRREADGIYWDCQDDAHSCASCRDRGAMSPFHSMTEED